MKKISILIVFMVCAQLSAQIDRSIIPKPGPTPEINIGDPQKFITPNGITVLVVENNKLPRVSVSLRIDNKPKSHGDKVGVSSLLGSLIGKGSTNIPMEEFYDEVDFMGASVSISSSGGSASSLTRYFPRIFEMFADAALNPNFTQEEFIKERDELISGLKTAENSVQAAAGRVEDLVTYGADHPFGEYTSEESVNNVTLEDVEELYKANFDVNRAYLVFVGNITLDQAKDLANQHFGSWTTMASVAPEPLPVPKNPESAVIEFVDMPNAVQSEIAVNYTTEIARTHPDYFAILKANQILGGGAEARLFLNLREDKGYTYGAYSSYSFRHHTVETFSASTSVRNAVTDSSVVQILSELEKLKNQPVSDEELNLVRAKYLGSFVRSLENPSTIANYAYNIITEGLPEDFYRTYLQNIQNVTVEDIQRVAQTYFPLENARIIVTGKGSDVLEGLENIEINGTKLKVNYYDKWGHTIPRPHSEIDVPEGFSVGRVIDAYIEAIGGREALEKIENIKSFLVAEVQGMVIEAEGVKSVEGKSWNISKMGGQVIQKSVVSDGSSYSEVMGQRIEIEGPELELLILQSYPFPELKFDIENLEYLGTIEVGDKTGHHIKISDNFSQVYDTETNLLIQSSTIAEAQGQVIETDIQLKDYQEIDGILIPHTITTNQMGVDIIGALKSVEFNAELDDSIFD
ncbi:MAG: pitrilysin family protein [Flavobacteriaceae bacterium]|nr:pitrilysin family protein [Flavobacteriaceae bacterium]MCY4216910.1 pitrilysin family protein [Flavobacteriaceae bacterium]MCY4253563.1 pitrilysin family protein [Flavobacteriaceae bacterium]